MNRGEILARAIVDCQALFGRYLDGFDESNRTRQAPGLPNHVAWCLGHCALTMHRAAEKIDGRPLPATHFLLKATRGDADHFGTESVSFASHPADEPAIYPRWTVCVAIFDAACARLAAAAEPLDWARSSAEWRFFAVPNRPGLRRRHRAPYTYAAIGLPMGAAPEPVGWVWRRREWVGPYIVGAARYGGVRCVSPAPVRPEVTL